MKGSVVSDAELHWSCPSTPPTLRGNDVHVWCASLNPPLDEVQRQVSLLSDEEHERARRYVVGRARQQFIVARGVLRQLLGKYLGLPPARISLTQGSHGKPALADGALHFNASHTHGLALFAFTRAGEVGVDVEQVRSTVDHWLLAERFFCTQEVAGLRSLPMDRQIEGFFHVWTRKEAFLKAIGLGLGYGVDRVEVSTDPEQASLKRLADDESPARWQMATLTPAHGYVGAVCLEGVLEQVRCWGFGQ